ncbi:hypothetical protein ACJX0J_042089, partial [Zea mays]
QPHIQFHISLQFRKEASYSFCFLCQVMCFIISMLFSNKLYRNELDNEGNQDIEKTIEKQFGTCVREIGRRIVELWLMAHIMEKILNFMTLADIGQWFYFGVIGLIRKHQPCLYQISHLWNVDEISSDEISKGMKHFCNMLLCIYKSSNLQENKASFHMFYQEEVDNYILFDLWFVATEEDYTEGVNTAAQPTSPIQAEVLLNVLPSNECVACCHANNCVKNKLNREKVQFPQCTGSQSYVAKAYVV